jgi:hypothetical protein
MRKVSPDARVSLIIVSRIFRVSAVFSRVRPVSPEMPLIRSDLVRVMIAGSFILMVARSDILCNDLTVEWQAILLPKMLFWG